MKISCFSTFHKESGSGNAALNFVKILKTINVDTTLYVSDDVDTENKSFVKKLETRRLNFSNILDSLYLRLTKLKGVPEFFSLGIISNTDKTHKRKIIDNSDVIFLFWINNGFLSLDDIKYCFKKNKKIIWRLSDEWPFTSGFHYVNAIAYRKFNTFQKIILKKNQVFKCKTLNNCNLFFISPSKWIYKKYRNKLVFDKCNYFYIPTTININVFKPLSTTILKKKTIRKNYKRILFGAQNCINDARKGFDLLVELTDYLNNENYLNYEFFIFGSDKFSDTVINGFNFISLGEVNDNSILSEIYNDAHVFISLSRFENLANTMLEATHCGIPIVSFNVGGACDIVKPSINGELIEPFNITKFAKALISVSGKTYSKNEINRLALKNFDSSFVTSNLKLLLEC